MKYLLLLLLCGLTVGLQTFAQDKAAGAPDGERDVQVTDSLRAKALAGDLESMNYLGYLLISGAEGTGRDVDEGLGWLEKAAEAGDVKAVSNLGWLYLQGELVEKDLGKAVEWISKAAGAGLPVAQSTLGDLYRDGTGVARDSLVADSLYREAFERGLADAGFKLYDLNEEHYASLPPAEKVKTGKYFYFSSIPSVGVRLFYMAADEGDSDALALLGDAYTRAVGVPYDHALSLKYYIEAARAGNPSAMFVLAELLDIFPDALKGNEEWAAISDDPSYWYERAAEAGVTDSVTATDLLFK